MSCLQSVKDLSENEIKNIFDQIDSVFFDIDGALVHNRTLIPGAAESVWKLRKLGKKIAFVTNNSFYPVSLLKENLKPFGGTEDEIVTPSVAVLTYLKKIDFKKDIYVIGSSILKQLLRDAGYNVIEYKDIYSNKIEENIGEIGKLSLKALDVCKNVGAVLVDFDLNFYLGDLQAAKVILNHMEDILFLCGPKDDKGNINETLRLIGPKFYIDGLERLVNREAEMMAKPGLALKDVLTSKFNITDDSRVLFVGDNVEVDIGFGVNSGFKTCLTLSGVTSKQQVEEWNFPENVKPTYVVQNLGELYEKIKDL